MDDLERRAVLGVAGLAGVAALSRLAHAGPLSPPGGAVASTAKPLTDVEPRTAINATNTPGGGSSIFTISQSGSYYLTGNVAVIGARSGILVSADDVTIDLMGFTIKGGAGVNDGVRVDGGPRHRVTVRNGNIVDFLNGVNLIAAGTGTACRVENVSVQTIAGVGIQVPHGSMVSGCTAAACGNLGIRGFDNCVIEHSTARNNTSTGISVDTSGVVRYCACIANGRGIGGGSSATVIGCSASGNTAHGIEISSGVVSDCSANSNGAVGIIATTGSVSHCSAANNTNDGINISTAVVAFCTARDNGGSGIRGFSGCVLLNNTAAGNGVGVMGTGGILVADTDNRIEGNNAVGGNVGISVRAVGNLILRNCASGNTNNYDIILNNRYGPIVNIGAAGGSAVLGSSAASNLGTTDAHANFAY